MELKCDALIAGKYRLRRRLARGGMGAVWLAHHVDLQVDVALKFIRPEIGDGIGSLERFRREARVLAQLKSPHIVSVLDFGICDGAPYLAMEYLEGEDLGVLLERQGQLDPQRAFPIVYQAALGLGVAHRAGVIHRDVKPSNLFVVGTENEPRVSLIDFGIAKQRKNGDSDDTTQGLVLGSPAYMSPEQARGGTLTEATDVWSLAAVAYRILTGRPPIEGDNPSDTVVRICTEAPKKISELRPELTTAFDDLFVGALCLDRRTRLSTLDGFVEGFRSAFERFEERPCGVPRFADVFDGTGRTTPPLLPRDEQTAPISVANAVAAPHSPRASRRVDSEPSSVGRDSETASISLARSARGTHASPRRSSVRSWGWGGMALSLVALMLFGRGHFDEGATSEGERPQPTRQDSLASRDVVPTPAHQELAAARQERRSDSAVSTAASEHSPTPRSEKPAPSEKSAPPQVVAKRPSRDDRVRTIRPPPRVSPAQPRQTLSPETPGADPSPLRPKVDPVFGLPVSDP